jgi:hypothetical protein
VVLRFYSDNRTTILAAATVHSLGGLFFLIFVAALGARMAALEIRGWSRSAVLVGGVAGGALMLGLMGGHSTGATTDAEILSPDAAVVFWRISHAFFVAAEPALALFVGALALLSVRARVLLPRWLGWPAAVLALVLLIPPIAWVGVLFLLPMWLVVVSLQLYLPPVMTGAQDVVGPPSSTEE